MKTLNDIQLSDIIKTKSTGLNVVVTLKDGHQISASQAAFDKFLLNQNKGSDLEAENKELKARIAELEKIHAAKKAPAKKKAKS